MEIKSINLKLKQSELAKELGCSSINSQRYRQDINMFSPYRISPNSHKRKQKISNHEHDLERPQLTSNEVTNENVKSLKSKNRNNLKGGSIHKNIEKKTINN